MELGDFRPTPKLVTRQSVVTTPAFPVIDAHNHLGVFGGNWQMRPAEDLLARLEEAHVTHYVDLDGGWGEEVFDARLRKYKERWPEKFIFFGGPNWSHWPTSGDRFGEVAAQRFRAQVARGAEGLKIWKDFGLHVRDHSGALVTVDDERLSPLWAAAGELKVPVLIHIADPVAFFDPLSASNERWEEMHAHPDWQFPSPPYPSFNTLIEAFARLVRRFPQVTFIGAHVACYAENLDWVDRLMDECPNLIIDFSARVAELGRQPFAARRLFLKYQDRILFGIDAGPDLATYHTYYRFLETEDEYFDYAPDGLQGQGRWKIYGLNLPKDVLEKIYNKNAARLFKRNVVA
jgi:predicted TIM-barrel fold metal-dependent hydrolase